MHRTGIEDYYIIKDNQRLRFGYTTGTCAAAAAYGAAGMLLTGEAVKEVRLQTPKGIWLNLEILEERRGEDFAFCGVRKDGGDDPDATHGLMICARAEKLALSDGSREDGRPTVVIDGGEGVGRVTKAGMQQAVGEAAINPVPLRMIRENVEKVCLSCGYTGALKITISVPGGEKAAERTFNPRLGIVGGISILGTSGIVEPMSEKALIASIRLEMETHCARGEQYLAVTPGNYGETFACAALGLKAGTVMQCSNYVGETLDMAVNRGVKGLLFISHIGKFIKVAGGIMNTHSRDADCRAELMAAFALRAGADERGAMRILDSNTTDEALDILEQLGLRQRAMELALERIHSYMQHRTGGAVRTEAVIYGGKYGVLGQTEGAGRLLKLLRSSPEEGDKQV